MPSEIKFKLTLFSKSLKHDACSCRMINLSVQFPLCLVTAEQALLEALYPVPALTYFPYKSAPAGNAEF